MKVNRCFVLVLCVLLLGACVEKPKKMKQKVELVEKIEVESQLTIDSSQVYKEAFVDQIAHQSDTSFDSLLKKQFDYQSVLLAPIEQSMADAGLVDVLDVLPVLQIDLRYATTNNFVGEVLYPSVHRCFLRIETIVKLLKAYKYLHQVAPQYTFVIFDGARPQSVQYKMYQIAKDRGQTRYVANPEKGSLHNFGTAIDLSLYDIEKGQEVDMGTAFDFFGEEAQPRFHDLMLEQGKLTQKQIDNRNLLKTAMKKGGFYANQTEWWHFEAFNKHFVRAEFTIIK